MNCFLSPYLRHFWLLALTFSWLLPPRLAVAQRQPLPPPPQPIYLTSSISVGNNAPEVGQFFSVTFSTLPAPSSCRQVTWEASPGGVIVSSFGNTATVVWNVTTTSAYVIARYSQCSAPSGVIIPVQGQITSRSFTVSSGRTLPASTTVGCQGSNITFTALPPPNPNLITSHTWSVDGNIVITGYQPTYSTSILSPGQHTISCTTTAGTSVTGNAVVLINRIPAHVNIVSTSGRGGAVETTLTATTSETAEVNYEWSPATGLNNTFSPTVRANPLVATTYTVTVTNRATGCQATAAASVTVQPNNYNAVVENTILVAGKTPTSSLDDLSVTERQQTITYFDGLGRPLQKVQSQASPAQKDIVQPFAYDAAGREPRQYLPYTGGTNGYYKTDALNLTTYVNSQQYLFYQPSRITGDRDVRASDPKPYSATQFEDSPLNRVRESAAAGEAFLAKPVKAMTRTNVTNEVRYFTYAFSTDGTYGTVSSTGFYGMGQLTVAEMTDEHGSKSLEYKNKEGLLVLKKVQLSAAASLTDDHFALTYHIYDRFNQLRMVIQPQGAATLPATGNFTLDAFLISRWTFTYHYDGRGRMIEKRVPGSGAVRMVYNGHDQLILTQDSRQKPNKNWSFTKYDVLGRVVSTGLYVDPSVTGRDQAQMQAAADLFSGQFETRTALNYNLGNALSQWGYTINGSFPALNLATDQLLTLQYYDDYNFDNSTDNSRDCNPILESYSLGTLSVDYRTTGKPTATLVRKLGSTDANPFLRTVFFYDKYGRTIQSQEDNHLGGKQISFNRYDFAGKLLRSEMRHHISTPSAPQVNVLQRFEYDHAGRLRKVLQQHGNDQLEKVVEMSYNELGQLKQKKMGNLFVNSAYLQTVDYAYHIRGWLKSINSADPAATVPDKDLFGLELSYDQPEAGHTPQYNGNIASQRWVSRVDATPVRRGFDYHYDAANRLTQAGYYTNAPSVPPADAHLRENFSTESITYDRNGNIEGMKQHGLYDQVANGNRMEQHFRLVDDIRYYYQAFGNRLTKVEEQNTGSATVPSYNITTKWLGGDFQNGVNRANEYAYDTNGNLIKDDNKGIVSITYNHLNLPERIVMNTASNNQIRFTYSASGAKLSKEVFEQGGAPLRTDYCGGGFVYQRGILEFFPTAEGRAINRYFADNPTNTTYTYEYHYKDHLGNLRLAFRDPKPGSTFQATMEPDKAIKEEVQFANLYNTRAVDGTAYAGSFASSKLNAAANKTLGPFKTLRLQKNDVVKVSVQALYKSDVSSNLAWNWTPYLSTGSNVVGGAESGKNTTLLQVGINVRPSVTPVNNTAPKAYLQYLFYDESYTFIGSQIRMVPLSAKNAWQELMLPDLSASVDGYVQVLVANESNVDVYFDDLTIQYEPAIAVQETHYGAFGNNLAGIEKQGQPDHKFQYGGHEKQSDLGLNYIDFGARMYDAARGQFTGIDPKAELSRRWSPYAYAYDNPIRFNDPDGMMPQCSTCPGRNPAVAVLTEAKQTYEAAKQKVSDFFSSVGNAISNAYDKATSAVGKFNDSLVGNEASDHSVSGSVPGGLRMTKTEGRDNGGSAIGTKQGAENRDITVVTNFKGVGPAGGSPATTVTDKLKEVCTLVNTALDAASETNRISPANAPDAGTKKETKYTGTETTVTIYQRTNGDNDTVIHTTVPNAIPTNRDKIDTIRIKP